jgi:hypothetical protein
VLFDPDQRKGPDTITFPPNYGAISKYLQAYGVPHKNFLFQEFQIWRVNTPAVGTANIAVQFDPDQIVDPCDSALDKPAAGTENVERGSEVTNVGPGQSFALTDSESNEAFSNCEYHGGGYADTADGGQLAAGLLHCDGGTYSVRCLRPYKNLANTCGGKPVS